MSGLAWLSEAVIFLSIKDDAPEMNFVDCCTTNVHLDFALTDLWSFQICELLFYSSKLCCDQAYTIVYSRFNSSGTSKAP
jgi:hypothetical protein